MRLTLPMMPVEVPSPLPVSFPAAATLDVSTAGDGADDGEDARVDVSVVPVKALTPASWSVPTPFMGRPAPVDAVPPPRLERVACPPPTRKLTLVRGAGEAEPIWRESSC